MANFNKVLLIGNLTRDPQLRYLPNQTAVAEFGIACNRRFKGANGEDRDEATFVECVAWAKTGEVINQYFTKGKAIFIEGRLKYDQWEDKQGGGKRSKLSVVVENFQFIGPREGGGAPSGEGEAAPQRAARSGPPPKKAPSAPEQSAENPISQSQEFKDDDIPF